MHTGTPSGFYATVGSEPRPFRSVGAIYPGLGIPSIPVWSGAPQIVEVFYAGLGFNPAGHVYDAGQHFAITGVIQNFKGTYEIYPITLDSIGSAPPYPVPVADSVAGTLTIATQNMLHFFNNVADGADTSQYTDNCNGTGASDTCPTAAQYADAPDQDVAADPRGAQGADRARGRGSRELQRPDRPRQSRLQRWRPALPAVHDSRATIPAASISACSCAAT